MFPNLSLWLILAISLNEMEFPVHLSHQRSGTAMGSPTKEFSHSRSIFRSFESTGGMVSLDWTFWSDCKKNRKTWNLRGLCCLMNVAVSNLVDGNIKSITDDEAPKEITWIDLENFFILNMANTKDHMCLQDIVYFHVFLFSSFGSSVIFVEFLCRYMKEISANVCVPEKSNDRFYFLCTIWTIH